MRYELTLAGKDADEAINKAPGSRGVFYELGEDADSELRKHPLAIAERGRPKRYDHIHLSMINGTDFVRWMGRAANGYHYQIGRTMRLFRT
jgi:hypothetical protein